MVVHAPTNDIVCACNAMHTSENSVYIVQPIHLVCLSFPTSVSECFRNVLNVLVHTSDDLEDWMRTRESSQYLELDSSM